MNKKDFNKIVLVSLCDDFSNKLGTALSADLEMIFCDTKALVEYELVDRHQIEELASVEYLQKCERKAIKHIASFENVIVAIGYDYLVRNFNLLEEKALLVFVELTKTFVSENEKGINSLVFTQRTNDLKAIADVCISLRKTDIKFASQKVLSELGRFV